MRFTLCLIAALTASVAAQAETISLRCTITPKDAKPYAGYVWIDMPTRRALEQWFPSGERGPIAGPFHTMVLPNTVEISDPGNIRIERTTGSGKSSGAKISCNASDVKPPPFPALPAKPTSAHRP